jgi:hypothetical protein
MHLPTCGLVATCGVTVTLLLMGATPQGHAAGQTTATASPPPSIEQWRSFEATASASGRREALAVEPGRTAVTLRLSGSLVLTRRDGLGKAFRADFIGFDDGSGMGTAKAVWTDDNGDRIFSRMVGTDVQTGRRTAATITGGTGRYAGITGTYTFTWQYVMPGEQGVTHVRVTAMKGRYRLESSR